MIGGVNWLMNVFEGGGGEVLIKPIGYAWLTEQNWIFFLPVFWPLKGNVNVGDIDFCLDHKETYIYSSFILICWTSILFACMDAKIRWFSLKEKIWTCRLCNRIPGIAFSDSPKLKAIKAIPVYFLKEGKVKCSS